MVGAVFRRVLWCFVVGGWPAVAALRMGLDPRWGMWLTLAGAPAQAACALLLRWLHAGARRRGRQARDRETERRIAELESRTAGLGDALAAVVRYSEGWRPESRRLRSITGGKKLG
jgi:hypothetical protein